MTQHTVQVQSGGVESDDAAALANTLADAIISRDDDLVVDCSHTTSLDAAAIRVLAEASALLASEGRQMHVRA